MPRKKGGRTVICRACGREIAINSMGRLKPHNNTSRNIDPLQDNMECRHSRSLYNDMTVGK